MTGKTAGEIIEKVGPPCSISQMALGRRLLQWQATGCLMALLFDANEKFVAISHQYAKYVHKTPLNAKAATAAMAIVAIVILLVLLLFIKIVG
jgi:hypothetical protein